MPFVRKIPYDDGTLLHIWAVSETVDDLMLLCHRRGIDTSMLHSVKSLARRNELMVERLLLHIVFGYTVELRHRDDGQPYVPNSDLHISISHTTGLVVIAVNRDHPVGVDVERRSSRVLRVRERFLDAQEQSFIMPDDISDHVVAWTAKEAMYKAVGDSDAQLLNDFSISPFQSVSQGTVTFTGCYRELTFDLLTLIKDDYVITLAHQHIDRQETKQP